MRRLSIQVVVLLLAASGAHATDVVQAPDRADGLTVLSRAGGWVVESAGRAPQPLNPGNGFVPSDLESLADGWLLTGTIAGSGGRDLVVLRGGPNGVEDLAAPGGRVGTQRGSPVAFIDNGSFLGLGWVEGTTQEDLRVRAAEWLGGDWGAVEEISPNAGDDTGDTPARGAQLAPTAAVLPNGDWLLLWAGFDGEDDEILWSRRSNRTWSPPRRLHDDNQVPDITPTVSAISRGALVAWSAFHEGHYRLRIARLSGDVWSLEPPSGGKGSLLPKALRMDDRLLILHRSVIPNGWTLRELDRDGTLLRQGFVAAEAPRRPVVMSRQDGQLELYWPTGGTTGDRTPSRRTLQWEGPR